MDPKVTSKKIGISELMLITKSYIDSIYSDIYIPYIFLYIIVRISLYTPYQGLSNTFPYMSQFNRQLLINKTY